MYGFVLKCQSVIAYTNTFVKLPASLMLLILAFSMSSTAYGASVPLTLHDTPTINAQSIGIIYTAATGQLVATGDATDFSVYADAQKLDIEQGEFNLSAAISADGALENGKISVMGRIPSLDYYSGIILSGELVSFDMQEVNESPLTFMFEVTGGDAAELYGDRPMGIVIAGSGFAGDFEENFNNLLGEDATLGSASAAIAPTPIPAAVWLFGTGLLGIAAFVRRKAVNVYA